MFPRMSRSVLHLARMPCARMPRHAMAVRTFAASALSAALFNVQGADKGPASIMREAAPGVQAQPYTLVFVSQGDRAAWQPWIGYFTTAGYNCIDLALDAGASAEHVSTELAEQVRLASLQREPVIFVQAGTAELFKAYLGTGGWFARRGPASGAVLIHPSSAAAPTAAWPTRMPVVVVPRTDADAAAWKDALAGKSGHVLADAKPDVLLKEIERVLREAGL